MTTKTRSRAAAKVAPPPPPPAPLPEATHELLEEVRKLGEQVQDHVRFMCAVATLTGSSAEVKERAVAQFHQRLHALEQELARIQENLQLE
jgi:hypothetical protein